VPHPTLSGAVFLELVKATRANTAMTPRGAADKEYFAQDWFEARLGEAGLTYTLQGRNSYPDYWVTRDGLTEGFEVKSLAFARGRPARKDIDFNSTIPSGKKEGRDVFLVFFLYTGAGANPRPVHTISVVHGDLINSDHGLADDHVNVAIRGFGSFADGFIRSRKMYVFPTPVVLDHGGLGRSRLVLPEDWGAVNPGLTKVATLARTVAADTVQSYSLRLRGRGQADVRRAPATNAGKVLRFNVFEATS